ncbi:MAG: DUF364 domain-containing protein [Haloplanus sp.]
MTASLLDAVHARLRDRAAAVTDPRVTVGGRVLLVEVTGLDGGRLAGLAHRPRGGEESVATDPDSVSGLAAGATEAPGRLDRAVGVATLNALSVPDVDWQRGDPMAALSTDVEVVATVGLFRPAFRKFDDVRVRVVERDPPESVDAPAGVAVETFRPGECEAAFDGADVCFVTGSTLVYGGTDRYLSALDAAGVAPVVMVGATASHVPGPAFAAGVDVVAGALVTDVDRVRERVRAGDCGTDLHDAGLAKVYVTRPGAADGTLSGLELRADTDGRAEPTSPPNTDTRQ